MKLLYCNVCHEIVQLRNELRCCEDRNAGGSIRFVDAYVEK